MSFPALVDPDYATGFGAVPKTFLVDETGVVVATKGWEEALTKMGEFQPVTDSIRSQWTEPGARLNAAALAGLVQANADRPEDLEIATQLASRYLALGLLPEARSVLKRAVKPYDAQSVARAEDEQAQQLRAQQLAQAYFQLSRAWAGDRDQQVEYATLSFYLHPTVGFGKQIARIIAPEKFDGRPQGDFDNDFREETLRRLTRERKAWLAP